MTVIVTRAQPPLVPQYKGHVLLLKKKKRLKSTANVTQMWSSCMHKCRLYCHPHAIFSLFQSTAKLKFPEFLTHSMVMQLKWFNLSNHVNYCIARKLGR